MTFRQTFSTLLLTVFLLGFGNNTALADGFPKTALGDARKVRSNSSPAWLQAVGRSVSVTSGSTKEACSWSLVVDQHGKDGVIVVGAGHCVDQWYEGGDTFKVGENQLTWITQSGQKVTRKIVKIFAAHMATGDYAIAKLDRPISQREIKPLMIAPYDYVDMMDRELFYSNNEPFKPFATLAGYSADSGLGQKGRVLTYDDSETCGLNGGASGAKKATCWSYPGASGGAVTVTLFLSGDLSGDAGGLWLFEDELPDLKPGAYTFWVGNIFGGREDDDYASTFFTDHSLYASTLDKILAKY